MTITSRLYQLDQILSARGHATRAQLLHELGISWATLKRDLAYLKDRLNAPVVFDRDLGAYRYQQTERTVGPRFQLPGLWFDAPEIHALMTMHQLLSELDTGGLIGPQVKPLLARLTGLLGAADNPADEVRKRVRLLSPGRRALPLEHFQAVGAALLARKRLQIRYHARGSDTVTQREVSP